MSKQSYANEVIQFRIFRCPDCGGIFCWVNPRLPTYCVECGKIVLRRLEVLYEDPRAILRFRNPTPNGLPPFIEVQGENEKDERIRP